MFAKCYEYKWNRITKGYQMVLKYGIYTNIENNEKQSNNDDIITTIKEERTRQLFDD